MKILRDQFEAILLELDTASWYCILVCNVSTARGMGRGVCGLRCVSPAWGMGRGVCGLRCVSPAWEMGRGVCGLRCVRLFYYIMWEVSISVISVLICLTVYGCTERDCSNLITRASFKVVSHYHSIAHA